MNVLTPYYQHFKKEKWRKERKYCKGEKKTYRKESGTDRKCQDGKDGEQYREMRSDKSYVQRECRVKSIEMRPQRHTASKKW